MRLFGVQSRKREGCSVLTIGNNRTQHSVELVSVRRKAVLWMPAKVSAHPAVVHHWHEFALATEQPWESETQREKEVRWLLTAALCGGHTRQPTLEGKLRREHTCKHMHRDWTTVWQNYWPTWEQCQRNKNKIHTYVKRTHPRTRTQPAKLRHTRAFIIGTH